MNTFALPKTLLLLVGLLPGAAWAQSIGIGTTAPDASAMLDIVATNKGVLVPRITQAARTGMAAPAVGLLVYQRNGTQPGFWYYAGTPGWTFIDPAANAAGDNLGNHTATQNLNLTNRLLVGGTAAAPGTTGLRVDAAGNVGIGITAPVAKLDITTTSTNQGVNVALNANSNATGINVSHAGTGVGVRSTSTGNHGVWGITQTISGAGVIGDNATGEAVVGRSQGGAGIGAVVGRNDAAGYGVRGFNTSTGIGVLGQAGSVGGTGIAGRFENTNANNVSDVMQVSSNGNGQGINLALTKTSNGSTGINVAHSGSGPGVQSTSAGSHGVWGITQTISGAGVIGDNATGEAVVGRSQGGAGVGAVVGRNDAAGYGVRGFNTSTGIGVLGQAGTSGGTGIAGRFENTNGTNNADAVQVATNGNGQGLSVSITKTSNGATGINVAHAGVGPGVQSTSAGSHGVWGITQTISGAGVIGDNATGEAVVGRSQGGAGVGAVVGRNDAAGYGVRGFNTSTGIGVLGQAGTSGGTGVAGRFENTNTSNTSDALQAASNGTGWAANFTNTNNTSGSRGVRIETTAGQGGNALNVVNGTLALGAQTGYLSGTVVDNAVLVVNTAGNMVLPTAAPLVSGATVWVVNNAATSVTVTNTTAGPISISSMRAAQFLFVSSVNGANWIPVQ